MVEDVTASFIKVRLCNKGEDSETPWAEDLGPVDGPQGSRRVRLVNVPFLHAKPTWGDVIIVSPVDDGLLTWDSKNVAWSKIDSRIEEDGGRFAMIVDYTPHDGGAGDPEFLALHTACTEHDVICEGAWAPRSDRPGRAYLAVPDAIAPAELMQRLAAAELAADLQQVHPKPGGERGAKPAPAKPVARPAHKGAAKAKPAAKRGPKAGAAKLNGKRGPKPAAVKLNGKRGTKARAADARAAGKRGAKSAPAKAAGKRGAKSVPAKAAGKRGAMSAPAKRAPAKASGKRAAAKR